MNSTKLVCWRRALLTLAVCASPALGQGPTAQPKAPITPKDAPIVLFNASRGKDLSNFYSWVRDTKYEDPRKIFNIETDQGQPVIGKIQIQTEQAEIYYRRIELHPLKK